MATKDSGMKADERSCPWCAETIKSAAIICKHCKKPISDSDSASNTSQVAEGTPVTKTEAATPVTTETKKRAGNAQLVWGIILLAFAGISLLTGDFSLLKLLFFIALPIGLGIWLIRKSKKQAELSASSQGTSGKTSATIQNIATQAKIVFSDKKKRTIAIIAIASVLLLVVGLTIKGSFDAQAEREREIALQIQAEEELAAAELVSAQTEGDELLSLANTRYEDSAAWSNDADRQSLREAADELKKSLDLKNAEKIFISISVVQAAYDLVGTQAEATARAEAAAQEAAAKEEAARIAAETTGQRNARAEAKSYLKYSSFSRQGLIEQLEYEGYSTDDAIYGVDSSGADWNEQAVGSASSYLKYSSFSRQGLIDQLLYEGFTIEQAEYGASQNGY